MVCYHPPAMQSVQIINAINQLSQVDPQGSAVQAARAVGISFGDDASRLPPFSTKSDAREGSSSRGSDSPDTASSKYYVSDSPVADAVESVLRTINSAGVGGSNEDELPVAWQAAVEYANGNPW
jgi:hypothetical protein